MPASLSTVDSLTDRATRSEGATGRAPTQQAGLRPVHVGLLGLGHVGQAVARLASDTPRLRDSGLRLRITGALVRDIAKARRCARPARITTNASAFLRGHYDVVLEALGGVEPARSLVSRLLGRGIPVVTANKALIAAHGAELIALAERRGTSLRYEASALAAIPFLGTLAARPLVSDVRQFLAVVNGTSNFILSALERGETFAAALHQATVLGLTEPDPSRDLDGLDAADKLSLLAGLFGWGALPAARVDTRGIRDLTPEDLAAARVFGGTIKPVVLGSQTPAGVRAFVGPAWLDARHPLAALGGTLSGIHLSGRFVSDLFFSGPGAGSDVTAATMLDDAVEAVSRVAVRKRASIAAPRVATLASPPVTGWFVRTRFRGVVPDGAAVAALLAAHHLTATRISDAAGNARWLHIAPAANDAVDRAARSLAATHRVECLALRALA